jgi:hypothetical protein
MRGTKDVADPSTSDLNLSPSGDFGVEKFGKSLVFVPSVARVSKEMPTIATLATKSNKPLRDRLARA